MTGTSKTNSRVDLDDFSQDVSRIEDLADRVRLSGYGLAAPLVEARAAQMRHEVARTARRKGADHPETALRRANAARAEARFALFSEELVRARVSRPVIRLDEGAAIWGRVVDEGAPVPGLTVSAVGDGVRLNHDCTDEVGGFALELPAGTGLVLSVKNGDGAELHRDPEPVTLKAGQQQYREIDLSRGAARPCHDPGPDTPPADSFPMLNLIGRAEPAALSLLANQGLKPGRRSTEPVDGMAGMVISHVPEAGATVRRGDTVDYVVGQSSQAEVPDLIGLTLERAQALLKKTGLAMGELERVPVRGERAGLIVDQSPQPGTPAEPGSAVNVSIGVAEDVEPATATVPDLTGLPVDDAQEVLKEAGLERGEVSEVPAPTERVGLVVGQSPGRGANVAPGSAVALVVGKPAADGGDTVTVPELRGVPLHDAEAILEAAGLGVGEITEKPTDRVPSGFVLEQKPGAGKEVSPGAAVSLLVGAEQRDEPENVIVPAVVGMDLERALALLKESGFESERVDRPVDASAQLGIVLEQKPAAERAVPAGTAVVVVIGVRSDTPPDRPVLDPVTAKIAAETEADLIRRGTIPADGRRGTVEQWLAKAGVKRLAHLDEVLALDRRELRELLGLRTLDLTDQVIGALKRARKRVVG